jgi:hypothetical protein
VIQVTSLVPRFAEVYAGGTHEVVDEGLVNELSTTASLHVFGMIARVQRIAMFK